MSVREFDAVHSPLKGLNLLEAGAGTGKTFTLSLIVLRLIVEQGIPLNNILTVTFTNAATAELRDRIRCFICEAVQYCNDPDQLHADLTPQIRAILQKPEAMSEIKVIRTRLKHALLYIDESRIFTIHGFCQRVLEEHAFESGSRFDAELVTDEAEVIRESVEDFWRRHIGREPNPIFGILTNKIRNPDSLLAFTLNCLRYPMLRIVHPESSKKELINIWGQMSRTWKKDRNRICGLLLKSTALSRREKQFKTSFLESRFSTLFDNLFECGLLNIDDYTPDLPLIERFGSRHIADKTKEGNTPPEHAFFDLCQRFAELARRLPSSVQCECVAFVKKDLARKKVRLNIRSFRDLLADVYHIVTGKHAAGLVRTLQARCRAVLIDEFQDTDALQYGIFRTVFSNCPVFLIGDPKQSIYSFRGADVFAYMKAVEDPAIEKYTLSTNYRSVPSVVNGVNTFFSRPDPFVFEALRYFPARSGVVPPPPEQGIQRNQADISGITIVTDTENSRIGDARSAYQDFICAEISALLTDTTATILGRRIQPGDIAVLTRANVHAREIKSRLERMNIPSVMSSRQSVFESDEAGWLRLLFSAFAAPSDPCAAAGILLTPLCSWTIADADQLQKDNDRLEQIMLRFQTYHRLCRRHGIIRACSAFMNDFNTAATMLHRITGQRELTNIYHLLELAHIHEQQSGCGLVGVLLWLQRQMQITETAAGEDAEIRLESDDQAVRILTIHASKGLQFPIVFCFDFPSMRRTQEVVMLHDRNKQRVMHVGMDTDPLDQARAEQEVFSEEIRMFYVAVTRARYLSYVNYWNPPGKKLSKTVHEYIVKPVIHGLEETPLEWFQVRDITDVPSRGKVPTRETAHTGTVRRFSTRVDGRWMVTSFSALRSDSHNVDLSRTINFSEAGNELFPPGPSSGNIMHRVFEEISFQDENHEPTIERVLNEYRCSDPENHKKNYLNSLVRQVLNTELKTTQLSFTLSDVPDTDRITEMEFFLDAKKIQRPVLKEVLNQQGNISEDELRGCVHGFMDLVFRVQGTYFITDWKSNYLGPDVSDYGPDRMRMAMESHGYGLQYMLYTLALIRLLKNRIPDYSYERHFGGVFYVFIRGVQTDGTPGHGIFHDKPSEKKITRLMDMLDGNE